MHIIHKGSELLKKELTTEMIATAKERREIEALQNKLAPKPPAKPAASHPWKNEKERVPNDVLDRWDGQDLYTQGMAED
jgi:hypothetical protein